MVQTRDRERPVADALVGLATALATGSDVVDLLSTLTSDCAELLDVASAGLLLADDRGVLHVMAASSERAADLEAFQSQRRQGPCLDCYRTGAPSSVPDLAAAAGRWPDFSAVAAQLGIASVHAVPMRLRSRTLGALGLFGSRAGALDEADLRLAQALADVASVALLQAGAAVDGDALTARLRAVLDARVVVEQAKGVIAHTGALTVDAAFGRLRSHARASGRPLADTARAVVDRDLPAVVLLRETGGPAPS